MTSVRSVKTTTAPVARNRLRYVRADIPVGKEKCLRRLRTFTPSVDARCATLGGSAASSLNCLMTAPTGACHFAELPGA